MEFEKLQDAVSYAVDNNHDFLVQRHFNPDEYMCEIDPSDYEYDIDTVFNCSYDFFNNKDDAEKFRMTNVWSSVVGNHQVIIDVQVYLDYYGKQEPVDSAVKKMILTRNEKKEELPF